MFLRDFRDTLQNLTKRKITNEYLGKLYGTTSQNISKRISNNSKVTVEEVELAQNDLGVKIFIFANKEDTRIVKNSLIRQNDKTVQERYENFGARLTKIQDEHEYLDKDMAKILNMSEIDYIYMKCGDLDPNIETLNRLKQCFEISIDWLLYGD